MYGAAMYDSAIEVISIENPANPTLFTTIPTEYPGGFVAIQNNALFHLDNRENLTIYDISDTSNITKLGFLDDVVSSLNSMQMLVQDNYLFVSGDSLVIVDISNPAQPTKVYDYAADTFANYTGIALHEDHLYAIEQRSVSDPTSLLAIDISSAPDFKTIAFTTIPEEVTIENGFFNRIVVKDDYIYGVGPSLTVFQLKPLSASAKGSDAISIQSSTPIPTNTPSTTETPNSTENTLPTNTPAVQSFSCSGAPETRLQIGMKAYVVESTGIGNLREAPASSSIIRSIEEGGGMQILDGPKCVNQRVWWFAESDTGSQGWISEGRIGEYWLRP